MAHSILRINIYHRGNPESCLIGDEVGGSDDSRVFFHGWRWGNRQALSFTFSMEKAHGGKKPVDMLPNLEHAIIISDRAKQVFEKHAVGEIEYLPAQVLDHRDRPLKAAFWIANVIGWCDCIDRDKTAGSKSSVFGRYGDKNSANARSWEYQHELALDDEYHRIDVLELNPARVPDDRNLFRLKSRKGVFIIRDDLIAAMQSAGLTGIATSQLGQKIPFGI